MTLRSKLALVASLALVGSPAAVGQDKDVAKKADEEAVALARKLSNGYRAALEFERWGTLPDRPLLPEEAADLPPAYLPQMVSVLLRDSAPGATAELAGFLKEREMPVLSVAPDVGYLTAVIRSRDDLLALAARDSVLFVERRGERHATPLERRPRNRNAQDTHQVGQLRKAHGLSGGKVRVGIWDEAGVHTKHREFPPRATQTDSPSDLSNHATHVAGTIGAEGKEPRAQGMAPAAKLECFDWNHDAQEMVDAVRKLGVVCSNHSYGYVRGWFYNGGESRWEWHGDPGVDRQEDYLFGKYAGDAPVYDRVIDRNQGLSVFVAAGNERDANADPYGQIPGWDGLHYVPARGQYSRDKRKRDDWDRPGFDTLEGGALAKNVITVGAIRDIVTSPPRPEDIELTDFSSLGPPDDGRVKPDVVANGWELWSPCLAYDMFGRLRDDSYDNMSGTSQAAPTATGIAALLNELANNTLGRTLHADEMKALLVHTAMSKHEGPTYTIGWGAIRADWAGEVLVGKTGTLLRPKLGAEKIHWVGERTGDAGVRVTLVWIDPADDPNTGKLDDGKPCLVLDLDLVVIGPGATRHKPWVLDPRKPAAPARRDTNKVDNVERVDVPADQLAAPGDWIVEVTFPAAARDRHAALVISGLREKARRVRK